MTKDEYKMTNEEREKTSRQPLAAPRSEAQGTAASHHPPSEIIRILLVEDHAVVRAGLRVLLPTEPGLEVVGEAADGLEAVEQARALQPDVVLLDLVMPRQDGLASIAQIKQVSPDSRIIVLTSFAED